MKEAFEKIRKRIEEITVDRNIHGSITGCNMGKCEDDDCLKCLQKKVLSIVSEVEAEYINKSTEHINKSCDCSTNWIDVKDRLPEKDGYYLTCDHKGNIHIFFHSQEFKETAPFGICEHHSRYYQPIAWMELPKPYTGKKGV